MPPNSIESSPLAIPEIAPEQLDEFLETMRQQTMTLANGKQLSLGQIEEMCPVPAEERAKDPAESARRIAGVALRANIAIPEQFETVARSLVEPERHDALIFKREKPPVEPPSQATTTKTSVVEHIKATFRTPPPETLQPIARSDEQYASVVHEVMRRLPDTPEPIPSEPVSNHYDRVDSVPIPMDRHIRITDTVVVPSTVIKQPVPRAKTADTNTPINASEPDVLPLPGPEIRQTPIVDSTRPDHFHLDMDRALQIESETTVPHEKLATTPMVKTETVMQKILSPVLVKRQILFAPTLVPTGAVKIYDPLPRIEADPPEALPAMDIQIEHVASEPTLELGQSNEHVIREAATVLVRHADESLPLLDEEQREHRHETIDTVVESMSEPLRLAIVASVESVDTNLTDQCAEIMCRIADMYTELQELCAAHAPAASEVVAIARRMSEAYIALAETLQVPLEIADVQRYIQNVLQSETVSAETIGQVVDYIGNELEFERDRTSLFASVRHVAADLRLYLSQFALRASIV